MSQTKKQKYYVVWQGKNKGVFASWAECQASIAGYPQALYKSFPSLAQAKAAFAQKPHLFLNNNQDKQSSENNLLDTLSAPIAESIACDAACSGNPGVMEYRCVYTKDRRELFHYKSPVGTNNIGEFLAIVHSLSYLKKHNLPFPLYTDSVNAIKWVQKRKCKTKLEHNAATEELFQYIERAENWLKNNTYTTQILKWDTQNWGECPADFGRK